MGFEKFAYKCCISHRIAKVRIFHSTPTSKTSKQQLTSSLFEGYLILLSVAGTLKVTKCKIFRNALCSVGFRPQISLNSEKAGKTNVTS